MTKTKNTLAFMAFILGVTTTIIAGYVKNHYYPPKEEIIYNDVSILDEEKMENILSYETGQGPLSNSQENQKRVDQAFAKFKNDNN